MDIGVYVDGFNLYYGARQICGRGTPGWRWLDIGALAHTLARRATVWPMSHIARVVYCTARVDEGSDPSAHADQDVYLRALVASGSVDHIEYGYYVSRVKWAPLAVKSDYGRPQVVRADWPVMVFDEYGSPVPNASFMVSFVNREEKGSDVNVATHLLRDVFERRIDGAMVISNDSDLRLPLRHARQRVPVAVVNPSSSRRAGALRDDPTAGAGRHWWGQLTEAQLLRHQLPNPVKGLEKPGDW